MSLEVTAKIGTHSSVRVLIRYKRKLPKVGDHIQIKEKLMDGAKWEWVIVREIMPLTGYYKVDRW